MWIFPLEGSRHREKLHAKTLQLNSLQSQQYNNGKLPQIKHAPKAYTSSPIILPIDCRNSGY